MIPSDLPGLTATLDVRLGFEAAHRLPALGGKCANLHGHSWTAEFTLSGRLDEAGILLDAGEVKAALRGWVDAHLDHAALLGIGDPLVAYLRAVESSVFAFGAGKEHPDEAYAADLPWPTTEAVAVLLHRVAVDLTERPGVAMIGVRVTEAPSIAASCP